jgi:putative pyruvate formate lyase activating enzyme
VVYSYGAHHGEEPPISGKKGSGTIFFSYCNMKCVYCQNYRFSQLDRGKETTTDALAGMMLSLQERGCHNINLVNPTHFVPQILKALEPAFEKGLTIPIVYNTGGYDLPETIRLLEGIVDIYLPDMRYSENVMAKAYSDAGDYAGYNRKAVKEMSRQVCNPAMGPEGASARASGDFPRLRSGWSPGDGEPGQTGPGASMRPCETPPAASHPFREEIWGSGVKGLIIRLLALPNNISGTIDTLKFIKKEIPQNACISIMSQYYPTFKACDHPKISGAVGAAEYKNIVDEASLLGLNNTWVQEIPARPDDGFLGTNIKPI